MTDDARLLGALAIIQARGGIGERSLAAAVDHADRFVSLIPPQAKSLIDLGSGGGLPALVIAWRCPHVNVTMVERRATRADMLRRAVVSLEVGEHCTILASDVCTVSRDHGATFDVATARSFADLATTAQFIEDLLAPGGVALVSEPPSDRTEQWAAVLRNHPRLLDDGVHQGIRRLLRPC